MSFKVKTTAGGSRNVSVQISGFLPKTSLAPFELVKFEHHGLKLTSLLFLIQEKAGLYLWWDRGDTLILPLESRGAFKFDTGIKCPDDWDGTVWASTFNSEGAKGFLLLLDFDK